MLPIGMVYGNAEVRGRLRVWKQQLAQHYTQFDVAPPAAEWWPSSITTVT